MKVKIKIRDILENGEIKEQKKILHTFIDDNRIFRTAWNYPYIEDDIETIKKKRNISDCEFIIWHELIKEIELFFGLNGDYMAEIKVENDIEYEKYHGAKNTWSPIYPYMHRNRIRILGTKGYITNNYLKINRD